jgi:CRISPR system Cascade subunit CasD
VRKDGRQVKTVWGEVNGLSVIKMTDYHTVKKARQDYVGLKSHETIQTWREYLLDAEYTVAIWGGEGTAVSIEELEAAIRKPIFTPYLGRRSCPLAQPLLRQRLTAQNAVEALHAIEPGGGVIYNDQQLDGSAGRNMRLRDVPMPGQPRQFASRTVHIHGGNHVSE